jgi:cytochrome c oxidase cbb3-type subunit 3
MRYLVVLLALAGCDTHDRAAASAPPSRMPIGPVPGPGEVSTVSSNPYGGDKVALGEGRRLFVRWNCSGCHGDHGGGGMGPSLRDPDWIYGDSDDHVFASIAQGRAHGMPAWGVKIPEQQVWKLVTYIQSLRTRDEPEAP